MMFMLILSITVTGNGLIEPNSDDWYSVIGSEAIDSADFAMFLERLDLVI